MNKPMRFMAVTIIMLLVSSLCFGQEDTERASIKVFKKLLGYRYTYQTRPLTSWAEFQLVMRDSPEALSHLKWARIDGGLATGLSLAGGALIGWPVGQALAGSRNPAWVLAAVGGGLVAVSIGFSAGSGRQLKKAVDGYNQEIGAALALQPNGISIQMRL